MRLGGVFAIQSLDGVRPADIRRRNRYRASEANVPDGVVSARSRTPLQDGCRVFASDAIGVGRHSGTAVNAKTSFLLMDHMGRESDRFVVLVALVSGACASRAPVPSRTVPHPRHVPRP